MKLKLGFIVLVLVAAACGGDDETAAVDTTVATTTTEAATTTEPAPTTTTQAATTTEPAPTTTSAAPTATAATVTVGTTALGDVLVDGDGNALYLFVPDAQGASVCYDDCAANWPPLVGEVAAGSGLDESLLGSVARDDGSLQATYNGWPLYYFIGDSAAGDTNGQGLNEVWYVLSAAGDALVG